MTSKEETDITTIIQRRPQHPRRTGRDQSEQLVAIRRNEWSRSSECAEAACSRLRSIADIKDITEVLNNASDYDPEDVKFNKQEFDGISECKSVKDPRELGRRLEDSIMDQFAVNTRCGGVAAYIEGYDKFDGKFNAVAMQAEERNDYWGLMVDYAPGSKVYSWALFPTARSGRPNGRMISGEGAASQIAEQVCIVVTGRGAGVR